MALTESYMLPLDTKAPAFSLQNVSSGSLETLDQLKGKSGTLIVFMCNHCPYVVHLIDAFIKSANEFSKNGINCIAISSNSIISHPQDGTEDMKKLALRKKFPFPYLYDESQEVAHAYKAACTPDFYLFDSDLKLYYRGRYDDSRPGNEKPLTGKDLHEACNAMIAKKQNIELQYPSMGCNIKWHQGNSPEERN
ncbi:thioredoxin family protein [Flavobacteriaceae bacterium]|nr:thioredoxin family protein [Flavobacteriaceae bacterium]